jgi:hypothetical protein
VIESKIGQRLMGLVLFLLGSAGTAWMWYTALTEGYYYRNAAALLPVCAVFGLGLLLAPFDVEKLRAEHGVDKPQKWAHYPPVWKLIGVLALLAGLGNWFAIAQLG